MLFCCYLQALFGILPSFASICAGFERLVFVYPTVLAVAVDGSGADINKALNLPRFELATELLNALVGAAGFLRWREPVDGGVGVLLQPVLDWFLVAI